MDAVPGPTATTRPSPATVATLLAVDVQTGARCVSVRPSLSVIVAVSVVDAPMTREAVDGETVTAETVGTTGAADSPPPHAAASANNTKHDCTKAR